MPKFAPGDRAPRLMAYSAGMRPESAESIPNPSAARVEPRFRHYAWGDARFIPELFAIEPNGEPYAEAWFGAHALFPSLARIGDETLPLDRLIAADPARWLGNTVEQRFAELPYLAKILSAARPLSIQVHPSKAQASAGFRRENAAGIALDAPERSYRDQNHKPELLVALTRVYAVCGFRALDEIALVLDQVPELAKLLPARDGARDWLRRMVSAYLTLPDSDALPALSAWLERLAERPESDRHSAERWVLESHRAFSREGKPDRGLFLLLLLNLVVLEPWDALFLEAGVPHAYLEGSGIEVMTNSDNVLRCGLTPKHVAPEELSRIVRYESSTPFVIRAEPVQHSFVYRTPAAEFELERLALGPDSPTTTHTARGPELVLFLPRSAEAKLSFGGELSGFELTRSESCLICDGSRYELHASAASDVLRVTVPEAVVPSFRGRHPTELAFGTSGLRGLVSDITDLEAYVNVRGFLEYSIEIGELEAGGSVIVAGDLRPSSDRILVAVARAIDDLGLSTIYGGRIPTPALAFAALERRLPGVMVTGSHIPFDRNGIKFYRPIGEVTKDDEGPILRAVERVRRAEYSRQAPASIFGDDGELRPEAQLELPAIDAEIRGRYVARYLDFFPPEALLGMRVVVYEHSAVGRELVSEVLERLGADVHALGRTETFVPIDTEAISEAQLATLQSLADEAEAKYGRIDALVSTDGDSDRPLVLGVDVDKQVRFFPGDMLGMLVAEALAADAIAVPVSATDAIERHFGERSLKIARTRIGSPWVIAAMAELDAERRVGFEANGGFLIGSTLERGGRRLAPLPTRDALLPILSLLCLAKERLMSLPELFATLPPRFGRSGLIDVEPQALAAFAARFSLKNPAILAVRFEGRDVYFSDSEGEYEALGAALLRAAGLRSLLSRHFRRELGFGAPVAIDFRDGIRIRFDNGDIAHVRGSGNAPQLRIYALADSEARAAEIAAACLAEPDGILHSLLRTALASDLPPSI